MPGAGQLNSLINILKGYQTDNEETGETETEYRPYHRKIPARREQITGGSTRRGHQVEETVKTVFEIPFIEDLSPHWRVELITAKGESLMHEIVSIIDRQDKRFWLELHCSNIE